ncbi:MAG: acetoacetate decarboxylase family protein [Peptococcaceae bacterium]|jgi:acetoacetate decarboxylase|nr:acetoacetate decarboxylase family protein [Peptococcaceae bacterium]MDH7525967.1 acetoacetate decarboxylase family protein [Peptococcaceae bacterium]
MGELKGFCHPLSPGGKSQLIGGPPWHFVSEQMIITYRAEPGQVSKFIPEPLKPSTIEPNGCCVRINSFVSVWDSEKEMLFTNPERCNFKEGFIDIHCNYQGEEAKKLAFIWVDNDFTLLRGWFMGAPKKLGKIYTSYEKRHLHELNPAIGKFGTGSKIKGIVTAHADRLITASMTLGKKITAEELPASLKCKMFNIIHFPNIAIGADKPMVNCLVQDVTTANIGEVWEAKDAALIFNESDIEEHILLKPKEITGAYFMSLGITFHGVQIIHDYNKSAERGINLR